MKMKILTQCFAYQTKLKQQFKITKNQPIEVNNLLKMSKKRFHSIRHQSKTKEYCIIKEKNHK